MSNTNMNYDGTIKLSINKNDLIEIYQQKLTEQLTEVFKQKKEIHQENIKKHEKAEDLLKNTLISLGVLPIELPEHVKQTHNVRICHECLIVEEKKVKYVTESRKSIVKDNPHNVPATSVFFNFYPNYNKLAFRLNTSCEYISENGVKCFCSFDYDFKEGEVPKRIQKYINAVNNAQQQVMTSCEDVNNADYEILTIDHKVAAKKAEFLARIIREHPQLGNTVDLLGLGE